MDLEIYLKPDLGQRLGDPQGSSGEWLYFVVVSLLMTIIVFLVYCNTLRGPFVFDDRSAILENESIRSLNPLSQALFAPKDTPTAGRPIVNLSFALNYAFGKLDVLGYHLVNVSIHCFNAMLLFALTYRSLSPTRWTFGASVLIAALWALHPMQTEAVSYITQRTELAMAFFFLGTMYAASRAWETANRRTSMVWQSMAVISCALGMASKETMVVAPIMIFLYDLTILKGKLWAIVNRRWPLYAGLASTWLLLAALMTTHPRGSSVGFGLSMKPTEYLTTQFWAITHYLRLAVWPVGLCADYGQLRITEVRIWLPCLCVLIFLAVASVWAWFRRRNLSILGFGFFLILAPTSFIVPIVSQTVAERRMYLPLAFVVVAVVLGAIKCVDCISCSKARFIFSGLKPSWALGILAVVLTAASALATYTRNEVYQSELAFWMDVAKKRPLNIRALMTLGLLFETVHNDESAIDTFRKVLTIDSALLDPNFRLGILHAKNGQMAEAMRYFERAIALAPNDHRAHCNLGKCYYDLGRVADARRHMDIAIEIEPGLAEARMNRGQMQSDLGLIDAAIEDYQVAVKAAPKSANAHLLLGNAYFKKGRLEEAITIYQTAIQLDPTSSEVALNLGAAFAKNENCLHAIDWLQRAIAMKPGNVAAYKNLGYCFDSVGRYDDAIAAYSECVSIQPNDPNAWYQLGRLLAIQRRIGEARKCFERVLQLEPASIEAQNELRTLNEF